MSPERRQALAIVFSLLLVTSTITPAAAGLEPPSEGDGALAQLGDFASEFDALPRGPGGDNGNRKGRPTQTTTTETTAGGNTTTTEANATIRGPGGDGPSNGERSPANGSSGDGNGAPGNRSDGSAGDGNGGAPGNQTGGPPENRSGGPPENSGPPSGSDSGPPPWAGDGDESTDERGPPEWVSSPETPGDVDGNRSNVGPRNKGSVFQSARVNVTFAENASAVEYRLAAIDALQDADLDGPGRAVERHRTKALEALNESLWYVLDANRTTNATLFELDKEASTPPQFAPNVTKLLVRSDQQLAETAISDAERVYGTLQARNISFEESAVRHNISEATAARDRAERFRDRGQYHVAITQYKVAWEYAQAALDQMDLATTPNVTITTREDMPHEGNVTYAVRGQVFDVRGHELDPLVLSLNGENRSVALAVNTTPGTVGTFETNLTLTAQVNDVTVSATDPNRRWAPDYDDANATTDVGRLRLDGDGLPDLYELNVTGTDPLGTDSNSTLTERNESDNGVVDGGEDHDADGVSSYYEYLSELKPHNPDTDGDGLTDGFEQQHRDIDPRQLDTNDDSISDAAEDLDDDGLTNLQEQNEATNPTHPDSDFDGLHDSEELANGTDPLAADTDDDGLPDVEELELDTDPTNPDTDSDGVLDGNETFSTTAVNETVGAVVNVSGEGNVAKTVTIENETNERIQTETVANASASEVLDFEADTEFEEANLSIDYDEAQVGDEDDLAVYTYNETLQTYVKLPSSVDAANDTVTGTTPHFSTFVVLNETEWTDQGRVEPRPNYAVNESFGDLDGWNCTGDCETDGGVVIGQNDAAFSDGIRVQCTDPIIRTDEGDCPGSGDGDDDSGDDGGDDDNGDDGDDGPDHPPDLCPFTHGCDIGGGDDDDGDDDDDDDGNGGSEPDGPKTIPPSELEHTVDIPADAVEVTVRATVHGFAEESNASVEVSLIAGSTTETVFSVSGEDGSRITGSKYVNKDLDYAAGETLKIRVQTENLSGAQLEFVDVEIVRDSDGDGLSNSFEEMGIPIGTGERVYTDPHNADTDGDGLSDGEEVGELVNTRTVGRDYYQLNSNPTEVDSDTDGLDDFDEYQIGTGPVDEDTDNDGTIDSRDGTPFTNQDEKTTEERYREYHREVEQAKQAVGDGAVYGEFGAQGKYKRPYADSPYYLAGWIVGSVVPIAEWPADLRDAVTNAGQGDFDEMLLDLVGFLPFLVNDAPKAIKVIETWVSVNPGKADEAYHLLNTVGFVNHLPKKHIPNYYRAFGEWDDLKRLKGQVADSKHYQGTKHLSGKLRDRLNDINNGPISGKVTERVTLEDVKIVKYDDTGTLVIVLKTSKWKSDEYAKVLEKGPGWQHLIARHGHPAADPSDFVVIPGRRASAKAGTTLFPKKYTGKDIEQLVTKAIDNTDESITLERKEAGGSILVYDVGKDGIEELHVLRNKENGMFVTAWPEGKKLDRIEDVTT